jgi:hypothetical protein
MQSLCTLRNHCHQWPPQHSLPSGRYSLLGPDYHRLDRTSFALAHLFDYLISGGEERGRHHEAKSPGALEIEHQVKFGWLRDG